jgi:hypothetical protein
MSILRSITPLTGALIAGLCVAVPLVAAGIAEIKFGRPSSTAGLIFPFAIIWGTLAAAVGAGIGRAVADRVRTSRWAGPVHWRTVSVVLVIVLTTLTTLAVRSVFRLERLNAPRVITSTGTVVRSPGRPVGEGWAASGALLWKLGSSANPIEWNGRRVVIEVTDDALQLRAGNQALPSVDLAGLSYVREVYGLTVRLGNGASESLVLLARLRATSGRDLLVILDPQGTVAHLELLERPRGREPRTTLWTEGQPPDPQEVGVNLGVPLRYAAAAPGRGSLPAR